ncbi:hypothetical protein K6W16_12350 [Burkholderia dolosa]|uniref:Uncharacterized protein n=1 Tax=Burkholderia dolosa TaxID=152500 RepID=A0A892ID38_9BURK|nr:MULTISPECIES: hypothetical protein [Burkholderia]MBR8303832.1 hypothetical protein [Burkholderia dolosa]MBR8418783.1 hypothetical protein [Burkholderia dolosa]MBR8458000.1 hypothetical protein [Burkholderia dolosa]MBY4657820.1 hypothetical protein [Burkholderia dolosa]MBY4688398.1 hypothetical protein [Burkholderia dolosa]
MLALRVADLPRQETLCAGQTVRLAYFSFLDRRHVGPVDDRTATPFSTAPASAKQKSSADARRRVLHCGAFASEREKPPNKEDRTTVAAGDPY